MRREPAFLTVAHMLAVHRRMIGEFGGEAGLRDEGLLQSAVMMPAARYEGEYLHEGVPAMAAAYLYHICQNHAFVDGNKRTALAAAEVFLMLNGRLLRATDAELEGLVRGISQGATSKAEVVAFFRERAHRGGR